MLTPRCDLFWPVVAATRSPDSLPIEKFRTRPLYSHADRAQRAADLIPEGDQSGGERDPDQADNHEVFHEALSLTTLANPYVALQYTILQSFHLSNSFFGRRPLESRSGLALPKMDLYRLWRILYHGCSSKVKQSKGYKVMLSKPIFHENWLILTGAAVFLVLRTFSDLNLHSVIIG
jgi:hypothetical protein